MTGQIRAYILDDEPLAVSRLQRLLQATGKVDVIGSQTDPVEALADLSTARVDVLFLDIQMPGMSGFDLLSQLPEQPLVVFTTAYHQYALQAFEVNSIDYLLKPVDASHLDRALLKLERIRGGSEQRPELRSLLQQVKTLLHQPALEYPERVASRTGERVEFVELSRVTHFYAQDKLTYAATGAKAYAIDATIADLEQKLDPRRFLRIHRSTIVQLAFVHELYTWFGGRMLVRLKDNKTELTVARDRVKILKDKLGL